MRMPSVAIVAVLLGSGCGPSTDDLRRRDDRIRELQSDIADATTREGERERAVEQLQERLEAYRRLIEGLAADAETLHEDREGLRRSLEEANEAVARLRDDRGALSEELAGAANAHEGLRARLDEAHRALEDLRARERLARARLETYRGLLRQLRTMIDAGHLRVRILRNRMVVELPEAVLFDSGSADVKPAGREVLTALAPVLTGVQSRAFQVAGHTDDVPIRTRRFPSNWELSLGRAMAVTRLLIEAGLPPTRVSAAGYADTEPVAPNDDDAGRQQNRRIEIVLVPNLEELPDLTALEEATQR